jgi:putative ABC transport system substrate-binding protein
MLPPTRPGFRLSSSPEEPMRAKILVYALMALILATVHPVDAQQPAKIPRIGYLTAAPLSAISARTEAFRQGLRELGYVEGKNIIIEWRSPEGKRDRLPALAAELVRLKVDIIVTGGPSATRPAKNATSTIPIVMTFDSDPVGNGFAASLAHPGHNITGLSNFEPELNGKQLELLKETIPRLSRVAVFGTSTNPGNPQKLKEMELAAGALGVKLQLVDVPGFKDIEAAFQAAGKGGAAAVLWDVLGPVGFSHRKEIAELALTSGLPVIYGRREYVAAGGLMSYGVSLVDLDRRAATYVDKILKGAKPAELPIEEPRTFDLAVNLTTAKHLGLTISPSILYRADEVIR